MKLKGYFCILFAASLWGMIGPVSKLAFSEGVGPLETAFWRAVITWGFFAVHAAATRQVRFEKRDIPMGLLFGITGVTCFYGFYQLAVRSGGAALASVLLYTAPAWVALMSRIFFRESMTPLKLAALCLTLAGVSCVSLGGGNGTSFSITAVIFGLLSGFCYALYYILGKHFSGRYTSPNLFLYILPVGAACLFPWVDFVHKTPTAWTALGILAFFSTYGAYYFYYIGLKHLEPTRAAITATVEPVVAGVVAWLWWGEYFTISGYMGSLLILSAVVLMVRDGT